MEIKIQNELRAQWGGQITEVIEEVIKTETSGVLLRVEPTQKLSEVGDRRHPPTIK